MEMNFLAEPLMNSQWVKEIALATEGSNHGFSQFQGVEGASAAGSVLANAKAEDFVNNVSFDLFNKLWQSKDGMVPGCSC